MDEVYVTYVGDEHVDNHDYDDNTDDDHDSNNDINDRACNARVNTSFHIFIEISIFVHFKNVNMNKSTEFIQRLPRRF